MKFKLVVFYDDDASLERYLAQYRLALSETPSIQKRYNGCEIEGKHISIRCIRGFTDFARGHKAHVVAVQEELTWGDKWPEMRDTILHSILLSCRIVKHVGERIETGSLLAKANGVVSSVYCWNGHYGRRAVFQSHEGRRNGVSHRNASDPHDGFFQPCRCVLACKAG